jgi:DNA mismatch repair ATPase MutL
VIQINKRKGITKIETQEIHSRHYTSKLIAFNMLVQTTLGGDEGLG